jgi:O26-antigen biosynthesis N-acetyl-L-fucosamine transferase
MRILLLADCYVPVAKSGATQMHDLAMEFHHRDHDVTVVTPSDKILTDVESNFEDGIRVIRVRTGQIKGASKIRRAVEEIRLSGLVWGRARQLLLRNPADLIVFYSPTIFWGGLVQRLKSAWHCPAYLILRDIFPAWAVDAGLLKKGLIYRYFRKKEIEQYEVADRIAVQSPANLQYFSDEFASRRFQVEVLYNWMNLRPTNLPVSNYRKKLGLENKVVFFYGGNLGAAQDLDNIVRLAKRLVGQPHVHFLLVGEGSEASRLRKLVSDLCLQNLHVLPAVSHEEYLAMLREFDVGLLSLDRRLKTHNVPGKILGYMFWRKPLLASINPGNDLFGIIGRNEAGYCISNGDDENLGTAALRLANDPDLRKRMGSNSRKLLEQQFSTEIAATQILAHVQPQTLQVPIGSGVSAIGGLFTRETFSGKP